MLDDNNFFQRAASSAYASMAAFSAASQMYNSFYPSPNVGSDPVNYFGCPDVKRDRLDPKIRVNLEDMELWTRFSALGNEMIITKNGRRLFPNFRVTVSNLDVNKKYMFLLDIVPVDDNRYKYQEAAWNVSGKAEPHIYGRYYVHPDSPQTGAQWMKQYILFNKVKITNNPVQSPNNIILSSMHRYIPRLHIIEASDQYSMRTGPLGTFAFQETAFIAVTAYQNDKITKLKINNNPFAKGFRETNHQKKSHSKPVKRLQSSHTSEKLIKYDENLHRTLKSDSSLSTVNSNSPPSYQSLSHEPAVDSTTPTYLDNSVGDHEQDSEVNPSPQKFDSSNSYPYYYPPAAIYGSYSNDPQSIMYNTSYNYIASTSTINSPSTSVSFNSYGSYPTPAYYPPQYNPSFF